MSDESMRKEQQLEGDTPASALQGGGHENDGEECLAEYRRKIDDVDRRIIKAISERANIVAAIGEEKRRSGSPVYAPHREREVLARVLSHNEGPLRDQTIEAVYRELMSGSFALERPLRIGYLGPRGSFSHLAVMRHFGSSVEFSELQGIENIFADVASGTSDYGLVPYENSIGGSVAETLDAFQDTSAIIAAEALVEIRHTLFSRAAPESIRRIYSHPQVLYQCRKWLSRQYPDAEYVPTISSSHAVEQAAGEADAAAIGSVLAGEIYEVNPVFENIQDRSENITRFLVLGSEASLPTGEDRTTIMFVTAHAPGALVDVLHDFRTRGINLSHIDKRPSGRTNWEYTFFIDVDVHREDPAMQEALAQAEQHCRVLKVLGSYPRAAGII